MNPDKFMAVMEAYYGKYNPTKRAIILEYIKHDVNVELKTLSRHVLEELDSRYKSQPDIATLKKAAREIKKNDPNIYYNGRCLGHYDGGRFIPDLTSLNSNEITRYVSEGAYSSKASFIAFIDKLNNPELEDKSANILQVEAPEQRDDI